jgi:hypothetical protein
MSGFDFDAPEDMAGESTYLSEEGTYHMIITKVNEGHGPKGGTIDGFSFEMDALGGTVDGVVGKSHGETFFSPKLSDKETAQMASKRKMAALFIAADLMRPDQLGKPVKIDLATMAGRQVMMKLARRMDKDESTGKYTVPSKFLQINYSDIYHVDDPAVKDIPKNAEALEMLEAPFRHNAEYFAPLARKATPKPVAAAVAADSYDDI